VLTCQATFLEGTAHAEVAIRRGEHRLGLSNRLEVQPGLDRTPVVNGIDVLGRGYWFMPDHRAKSRTASTWNQLSQISDDDVGSVPPQRSADVTTIDTDNQAKTAGASGLDARQGVFDHNGFLRGNIESVGGMQEGIGSRLAVQAFLGSHDSVGTSVEEVGDPGRLEDLLAVVARRHDRHEHLSLAQLVQQSDRSGLGFHFALGDRLLDQLVLAVAEAADALGGRIVGGAAIRPT
jgi:hypothetical protein